MDIRTSLPMIVALALLGSNGCIDEKDNSTGSSDDAAADTTTDGASDGGTADGTADDGGGNGDETGDETGSGDDGDDGDDGGNSIIDACLSYCEKIDACQGSPMPDPDDEDPPWLETCLGRCDYIENTYMPDANCAEALLTWYQCMVVTTCELHNEDLITTCQIEREAKSDACEGLE